MYIYIYILYIYIYIYINISEVFLNHKPLLNVHRHKSEIKQNLTKSIRCK